LRRGRVLWQKETILEVGIIRQDKKKILARRKSKVKKESFPISLSPFSHRAPPPISFPKNYEGSARERRKREERCAVFPNTKEPVIQKLSRTLP
jgi:hypothetical protein